MSDSPDHTPDPERLDGGSPSGQDRHRTTSRAATAVALDEINSQFEQALTDLEGMIVTALANALDSGRRTRSAKILAAQVPALEETERSLLVGNARLADVAGHEDQAVFTTRRQAWLAALTPPQRAVYDAARHGAAQVSTTLLRCAVAAAGTPNSRKGKGKRRKRR
ncbi:hypothetical protein ACQ86D_26480 [Streptomyces galilaeus]